MREIGIENVLALRGDPPQGETEWRQTPGGLKYSTELIELIELIASEYQFAIGAASFPEVHPEAADLDHDLRFAREKVEAGASFLITQLFFDNDLYFSFVEAARDRGIDVPIIPVTNYKQLKRITSMCGATIPEDFERELSARQDDPEAVKDLGVSFATLQCADLLARGAPGSTSTRSTSRRRPRRSSPRSAPRARGTGRSSRSRRLPGRAPARSESRLPIPARGPSAASGTGSRFPPPSVSKLRDRLPRLSLAVLGEAPALDIVSALERPRLAERLEPAQVAEHHGEPERAGHRVELVARLELEQRGDELERRPRAAAQSRAHSPELSLDLAAVALDVRLDVAERAPVPREAQPRAQRFDGVERGEELTHRVGRVPVVEVERDPAEQVVTGDQQAGRGLVQDDVRRCVARGLVDLERTEVGLDRNARDEVAVRLGDARDPDAPARARLAVAAERRLGDAALARDLDPPLERALGVPRRSRRVAVSGVHPQLAARGVDDRPGEAVVVGVRVGAHEQAHVLEAQAGGMKCALELGERARLVEPRVEQDDPAARRHGEGVDVRDAGPRERKAQTPHAGQHAVGAGELAAAGSGRGRAHRGDAVRRPGAAPGVRP